MEAVEIEVGIDPVWRFVCNPTNDPVWCRKVASVDRVAPDRWLVHHKPIPLRPTVVLTVEQVSATAPHRLLLREEDDASVFEVEYRLEATKSGVRFMQISEFWWKRLPVRCPATPGARGAPGCSPPAQRSEADARDRLTTVLIARPTGTSGCRSQQTRRCSQGRPARRACRGCTTRVG